MLEGALGLWHGGNTPQAKGRVERVNRTLQDRLAKELRLEGVSDMATANAFLPSFIERFNEQFARVPQNPLDAHRPLRPDEDLHRVSSSQVERTLSKNLVLHYKRKLYVITDSPESRRFAGRRCLVYEWLDGEVEIRCEGCTLAYAVQDKNPRVQHGSCYVACLELSSPGPQLPTVGRERRGRMEWGKLTLKNILIFFASVF